MVASSARGFIVLLSGPSGVGKGTIVNLLLRDEALKLKLSVSATTRLPRANEQNGVHYWFKTNQQFQAMIANHELLEYAKYVNHYYGTPLHEAERILNAKNNLLLEIECQGAMQVMERFDDVLSIFVLPPSADELMRRLSSRGSDSAESVTQRIKTADEEMAQRTAFQHCVVNDDLTRAVSEIRALIMAKINARSK